MFHQSIRFFRPGRPAIIRNSTGEWANQWRMDRRPSGIPPDSVSRTVTDQESFSIGRIAQSDIAVREHGVRSDSAFKNTPEAGHNVVRGADPTGRAPHSTASSGIANKGQPLALLPSFHESVRVKANDPTRHSDPVVGTHHKRDTKRPIETQKKPNASNLLASSIPQPGLDSGFHVSVATTALPTSVETTPARSTGKVAARRDWSPDHASVPFNSDHAGRDDAVVPKTTKTFGVSVAVATRNIATTRDDPRPPISNETAAVPRHGGTDSVAPGPEDSDLGERGSARPPAKSTSTDQSSNLVGELWLDSLSLREWLQAYLTREMGHALQATNRFGNSFE
ncbi:MAG: hypothetical protein ABSE20_00840 [Acetobacteraceae bacterium]|jgi:hypothetical protein